MTDFATRLAALSDLRVEPSPHPPLAGAPVTVETMNRLLSDVHTISPSYERGYVEPDNTTEEVVIHTADSVQFVFVRRRYKATAHDSVFDVVKRAFPIKWHPLEVTLYEFFAHQDYMFRGVRGDHCAPSRARIFAALESVAPEDVKVVIVGTSPSPQPNVDTGFAHSVSRNCNSIPYSVKRIHDELKRDLGDSWIAPRHGDLSPWAKQGVLLLNINPTTALGEHNSHRKEWKGFAEAVLKFVSSRGCRVYMLWGSDPGKLKSAIVSTAPLILEASHPGHDSDRNPFKGCGHFSAARDHLNKLGVAQIDWSL